MVANLKLVVDSPFNTNRDYIRPGQRYAYSIKDLQPKQHVLITESTAAQPSYRMLAIVLTAHVVAVISMLAAKPDTEVKVVDATPMMVHLISAAMPSVQQAPVQTRAETLPQKTLQPTQAKQITPAPERISDEPAAEQVTTNTAATKTAAAETVAAPTAKTEEPAVPAAAIPQEKAEAQALIEPPRFGAAYLNNPAPAYPPLSRRLGEQGRVLLKVLVSEAGLAEKIQIDTSSGYEKLDLAAVDAVKKWSFIPAKRSSQPISAYVLVPIKFFTEQLTKYRSIEKY